MPARPISVDDLPDPLPARLLVLVGDEELLVTRAISAIAAAARRRDPTVTETERSGGRGRGCRVARVARPVLVRRRADC